MFRILNKSIKKIMVNDCSGYSRICITFYALITTTDIYQF